MSYAKNLWGLHGQNRNTFLSKDNPHVGIGWNSLGDITKLRTKQEIEERYIQMIGVDKSIPQAVGQNYRFIVEAQIGDIVVYSKDRVLHFGEIISDPIYIADSTYTTIRKVKWLEHAPSSLLPQQAINEINSAMSFFALKNNPLSFLSILEDNPVYKSELFKNLKEQKDIDPHTYDGSYELIQTLATLYKSVPIENVDYKDLDALYLSVIGTWKVGFSKKKQKIMESNLSIDAKKQAVELLVDLEKKTSERYFSYSESPNDQLTMGMFGTGFMTFKDADIEDIKTLIDLIIKINDSENVKDVINKVRHVFEKPIKGVKTGVASVLLHCLKPQVFPIINRNMGLGLSVYTELGLGLIDPLELDTYADNTEMIIDFRDEHFTFKNFRVLDYAARILEKEKSTIVEMASVDGIYTSDTGLTVQDWIEILSDKSLTNEEVVEVLKLWYNQENYEASCKELSDKHGENFGYYNATIMNYGKKIAKERNIDIRNNNNEKTYWSLIMNGRNSVYNDTKVFNWTLKKELVEALEELNIVNDVMLIEEEKIKYNEYSKDSFLNEVFMDEDKYDEICRVLSRKSNIILQGSPGVGKTFLAKRFAYSILGVKDDSVIEMVQFHQSYSYEDFVFGYHPTETSFELKPGIFYSFCKKAEKNQNKQHFFIIDEINRGNLSKIFGELLMLIEADKRGTPITLSHTKELFSVPKNIYIIGMMNTADRSLAIIDYALRRRFSFIKIIPAFNHDKFRTFMGIKNVPKDMIDHIIKNFRELNQEITNDPSLGVGFTIGHSYFCEYDKNNPNWYQEIIQYDIKPILEEYWFDNPEKVEQYIAELLK